MRKKGVHKNLWRKPKHKKILRERPSNNGKNYIGGKNLVLYTRYTVEGVNLDSFINSVKKKGINLYEIKKINRKKISLCIEYAQNENFFAITKNLCYNIMRKGEKGKHYPLFLLIKNLGATIGAILFVFVCFLLSDFIFSFEFSGTGSVYKKEVENYLAGRGITKFTRFSDLNLDALSDEILASSEKLSFAEVKKRGNRLEISLALKNPPTSTLTGSAKNLISTDDGIIEEIKVYRGTALVKKGDFVKKGDLLVDGFVAVKDVIVSTNVIATVSIRTEWKFTYLSDFDKEEKIALALAEGVFGTDYEDFLITVGGKDGKFEYTVILQRIIVSSVG